MGDTHVPSTDGTQATSAVIPCQFCTKEIAFVDVRGADGGTIHMPTCFLIAAPMADPRTGMVQDAIWRVQPIACPHCGRSYVQVHTGPQSPVIAVGKGLPRMPS